MLWHTRIRRYCARFGRSTRGNVAITFAFATLPIIGAVGAAVDYSHANSVKAAMQAALDSTALMVAKDAPTLTDNELNTKALTYFKALFTRPEATSIEVRATYSTSNGSTVLVNGSARVPTTFMSVMGHQFDFIDINGSSTAKWGTTRLRVALALDNTGSMASDGKMTQLKIATKNLLDQLKTAANKDGDVYVSIIPFSKDVNVGKSNSTANWIDWSDWEDNNGSWEATTNCKNRGWSRNGQNRCTSTHEWIPADKSTWNGCITDRDQDYDQKVTAPNPADATLPGNIASTLFPAEQYGSCPVAMMGLNYNWNAMKSLVDSMQPNGNTNQPIGLVWGWQSLAGGGPFTVPPKQFGFDYHEIVILMSDGLNTENRWSGSQTQVDKRMYDSSKNGSGTCANIKAAGVTIYTIHVNTNGDPKSTLLENCASGKDKFWMITSASELGAVFTAIGTNLTQLRVAK